MNLQRIDNLITQQDFSFQAWNDRYSKGVWASLGLSEYEIDTVRDLSSSGDLDMFPAMDYVFSADWMPYVTGATLREAMQTLETRLASLPPEQLCRGSQWAKLVSQAIQDLADATQDRSWYSDKKPHFLEPLPKTFEIAAKELLVFGPGSEESFFKPQPNPKSSQQP